MDTRTGRIYDSADAAKADGVHEDDLVTGTPEAIARTKRLIFSKGSFKNAGAVERAVVEGPTGTDDAETRG